jgi:uncharacterized protein YbjT (DUF2867 family)
VSRIITGRQLPGSAEWEPTTANEPSGASRDLVTGATGNVGRHLVTQLLDAGQPVRALVRHPDKATGLDARAEMVVGDLDEATTLAPAVSGVRAIYAVAFLTSQIENLVAAARSAGAEHLVRQSTIEAGGSPPFGPGRWHREQEIIIEKSGIAWTHLRPTMMMVNTIPWWAGTIRNQGAVYFPGGQGRVSPVDPYDVAAVGCAVLTRPDHRGSAYEVTGPEVLTIDQMVQTLSHVLNKPLRYFDVSEDATAQWLIAQGTPPHLATALQQTLAALRASEYGYVADTVERLTGHPGRTFQTWCREHAHAFQ